MGGGLPPGATKGGGPPWEEDCRQGPLRELDLNGRRTAARGHYGRWTSMGGGPPWEEDCRQGPPGEEDRHRKMTVDYTQAHSLSLTHTYAQPRIGNKPAAGLLPADCSL
ncbi:hypothetical protein ACOMHN_006721 [Nucella lapillus]